MHNINNILRKFNKKFFLISAFLIVSLSTLFALSIFNSNNQSSSNNSNKDKILGEVVSAPVSSEVNSVLSEEDLEEQLVANDLPSSNDKFEVAKPQVLAETHDPIPQPEQCIPTLKAIIVRPYEFIYHLGDKATEISGSYESTCIAPEEVTYEWFIWGATLERTKFSSTAKPNFSSYEANTYDVLYKVHAKGLSSEVKTWVWVNGVPPIKPENSAPFVSFNPIDGKFISTDVISNYIYYLRAYGSGRDIEEGRLPELSHEWFVTNTNGQREFLGTGNFLTITSILTTCSPTSFEIILKATDSKGLSSEHSEIVNTEENQCFFSWQI